MREASYCNPHENDCFRMHAVQSGVDTAVVQRDLYKAKYTSMVKGPDSYLL